MAKNSPVDFQEGFLKTVFNFTGVNDVEIIRAEGVNMGPVESRFRFNVQQFFKRQYIALRSAEADLFYEHDFFNTKL